MKFPEISQLVNGFVPVDMSAGANNGDWVSLKSYGKVGILFTKAAGTAGDDPTLTLKQATLVDGTGSKDLLFTDIWKKQGANSCQRVPFGSGYAGVTHAFFPNGSNFYYVSDGSNYQWELASEEVGYLDGSCPR